jgi:hypothetical protein
MRKLKLLGIALYLAAFAAQALASGWTVDVSISKGQLFPGAVQVDVPFTINAGFFSSAPATVTVNTLPQITFLTNTGSSSITVGDGTFYSNGTFTGQYTITTSKTPLTGFYFVVSGFVQDFGQIFWTKKVVDQNTSQVLFLQSWVFSGEGYPGGTNGVFHRGRLLPAERSV